MAQTLRMTGMVLRNARRFPKGRKTDGKGA